MDERSRGSTRRNTAISTATVSAADLPARRAASTKRVLRSLRTSTGRVRLQIRRSPSQCPGSFRSSTSAGRSWMERRPAMVLRGGRARRRPRLARPRGSSLHSFSPFVCWRDPIWYRDRVGRREPARPQVHRGRGRTWRLAGRVLATRTVTRARQPASAKPGHGQGSHLRRRRRRQAPARRPHAPLRRALHGRSRRGGRGGAGRAPRRARPRAGRARGHGRPGGPPRGRPGRGRPAGRGRQPAPGARLRARPGGWRRPTASTPRLSPASPRRCGRPRGPCRTRPPATPAPWWGTVLVTAATAALLGLASVVVARWDVWSGKQAAPPATGPGIIAAAPAGGPFTMVDHTGRTVTDQTYRGKYLLVFFGYTHCPTTLDRITQVMEALGPDGEAVRPPFVSVDPKRDTPEVLAAYVTHCHPRIVGLTGSPEQVKAMAAAYRVYFATHDDGTADGTVELARGRLRAGGEPATGRA